MKKNKKIDIYFINAFTRENQLFSGNPASICPLEKFLSDKTMLAIAAQNNLPETAFLVFEEGHVNIRWFSPNQEVALCGHATLAAAYVIFQVISPSSQVIKFNSLSGVLKASQKEQVSC